MLSQLGRRFAPAVNGDEAKTLALDATLRPMSRWGRALRPTAVAGIGCIACAFAACGSFGGADSAPSLGSLCARPRALSAQTGVSHSLCVVSVPFTTSKKRSCSFFVMGPTTPSPMGRLSTSRTGVISAAVPVKKHSSASQS